MQTDWTKTTLSAIADFNPAESLPKGKPAKRAAMEKLMPFCRDVAGFDTAPYGGGAKFRNGDTIMARITPCLENGKTAQVNFLAEGEIGFGSTEYLVLRAKEGIADPDFLYYLARSPLVREPAIKSMVGSSGRQRVQNSVLERLEIALPPLELQREIGSVLRALDDKITLNRKIADNLQQQAQAFYTDMFITRSSANWRQGRLSELVSVKYGKDHKKLADGKFPVYGSGGIIRYAERPLYARESVLIPRKGTLNNVMYVSEPFWSVDTMFYTEILRPNAAKFVYHFLRGKNLASMNAGSAVPSMTTDILNAMELTIPDGERLAAFEEIVSPMYRTISANEKQSAALASIRDALLPRLISGELDASAADL